MNFQKSIKSNLFFFLIFLIPVIGWSQDTPAIIETPEEEQVFEDAQIFLKAHAWGDSIRLSWIPMKEEGWLGSLAHGFQIIKREIDWDGKIITGSESVIAGESYNTQLRPKDQTWFNQNATAEDGLMEMIGDLLYDPEMNVGENGNNNEGRFKTMIFNANDSDPVSEALGWTFLDKGTKFLGNYEYVIQSLNASGQVIISEKINIINEPGNYETAPQGFSLRGQIDGNEQDMVIAKVNQVVMSALPKGDSIILRWAPNNAEFWTEGNRLGYVIHRMTMNPETGEVAEDPEYQIFGSDEQTNGLLPWDSTQFKANPNESDSMVMIAAQVLYGKSFNIRSGNFVDQNSELQNRYAFAMVASERSPKAADALGLRFVDTTVEPGKQYRYQIESLADPLMVSFYTLYIENTKIAEDQPDFFEAKAGDHAIHLSWSKEYNQRKYSTYRLERSDNNGRTFKQLNNSPLFYIDEEGSENLEFTFVDSVEQNYKDYQYRLYGLNTFSEWSAPAELTSSSKDLTPPSNPFVTEAVEEGTGEVRITWEMKDEPSDLEGYNVMLGQTGEGLFTPLLDNVLPKGTTQYTYRTDTLKTDVAYYFKISAVDTAGNVSESFAHFFNVVDSIPPAAPTGLIGTIDSMGVVTIGWDIGEESDLGGYRVYYANSDNYEFTQKTISPTRSNFYLDTIEIKTLTEEIYYKVQGVDLRHNRGEFSEVLKLQKPDILPPTTPVFRQPQVSADSIVLTWIPSISDDVVSHILYRKKHKSKEEWEILATLGAKDTLFTDLTAETEQIYEYTLRAQDDADLFSDYAFIHKARKWFDGKIIAIQNLQIQQDTSAEKSITLNWDFQKPTESILKDVEYRFYVYRSLGDAPLERYRQLESGEQDFKDTKVRKNGKYNYAVKVVFRNGKASPLSEMVSLEK